MISKCDSVRKSYTPMKTKTLRNALYHRLSKEMPHLGGPRLRELCADMLMEVIEKHLPPRERVRHGQVVWMAYSVSDPPARHKRTADTEMVPVVLDLSLPEDLDARIDRQPAEKRALRKLRRLCQQAYHQGGLLSNCDLAELLSCNEARVAHLLTRYEDETQQLVPRRATVHDMGSGLTHKRLICRKRYLEGKPPEQVARETYHTLEAVDRYLGQYDRVRACRKEGMEPERIAYTLNCSLRLVNEYLQLDQELERAADGSGAAASRQIADRKE